MIINLKYVIGGIFILILVSSWTDAIRTTINRYISPGKELRTKYIYAVFITLLALIFINLLYWRLNVLFITVPLFILFIIFMILTKSNKSELVSDPRLVSEEDITTSNGNIINIDEAINEDISIAQI